MSPRELIVDPAPVVGVAQRIAALGQGISLPEGTDPGSGLFGGYNHVGVFRDEEPSHVDFVDMLSWVHVSLAAWYENTPKRMRYASDFMLTFVDSLGHLENATGAELRKLEDAATASTNAKIPDLPG